jgi:branched-subunit amino acid ABC-type transport system permease component
MNFDIALLLVQDGVVNGAIYALLALSTVLVFQITRVIFIPSGTFVAFGALTLAALQAGKCPATVWLLVGGGFSVAALDIYQRQWRTRRDLVTILLRHIGYPVALAALLQIVKTDNWPVFAQAALCCLILVPLGPVMYSLVYAPVAAASVLVLLIVSISVDVALVSFGLLVFGSDGTRAPSMIDIDFALGPLTITGQSLVILATSVVLIAGLFIFFEHTLEGKALRATAVNRIGARLMGIATGKSGKRAFALAVFIAVCAGLLAAPTTTIYYDTGFLIGLRGLVGAIFGGLASYPLAAVGAILLGIIEAVSAFEASSFKEVIVFSLLIPILLSRTLLSDDQGHEEE